MKATKRLATVLTVFLLAGCHSGPSTASAASGNGSANTDGAASSGVTHVAVPTSGTETKYIEDPTLRNINAVSVQVPAKWYFQGTLVQGDSCAQIPFVVYRATSPDGLTFVENMPTLHWVFGSGPGAGVNHNGCLPLRQEMSAQDFLKYFANMMKYTYTGDEPVPAEVKQKALEKNRAAQAQFAAKFAAMGVAPPRQVLQIARAHVSFMNGSFPMEGQLSANVLCTEQRLAGFHSTLPGMASQQDTVIENCGAEVRFTAAPEKQYAAVTRRMDAENVGYTPEQDWLQAYINRSNQRTERELEIIDINGQRQREATAQYWEHARAVSTEMHNQFMQGMQDQFNHFEEGQAQNQAARSQFTSDMVDFALDQQTVADPNTGQLSKVSNTYSHTWVDDTGKVSFQTNNINADPNGYLNGNWTRQTVVHGDGTSY